MGGALKNQYSLRDFWFNSIMGNVWLFGIRDLKWLIDRLNEWRMKGRVKVLHRNAYDFFYFPSWNNDQGNRKRMHFKQCFINMNLIVKVIDTTPVNKSKLSLLHTARAPHVQFYRIKGPTARTNFRNNTRVQKQYEWVPLYVGVDCCKLRIKLTFICSILTSM